MADVMFCGRGEGEIRLVAKDHVTAKATGEATDGQYTAYEVVVGPNWGPPLHRHAWSEFFYVLEGEIEFQCLAPGGIETIIADRGATLAIPAWMPHAFRNPSNSPAKFLIIDQPVGIERFFRRAGVTVKHIDYQAASRAPLGPSLKEHLLASGVEFVDAPSRAYAS